ncbi:MAG: O-antigen ligase family protein [Candidatus Aerophobetes bacterium]|nr:O-antigen ligase family protein [Candidatus Aerophobetes bacterium]
MSSITDLSYSSNQERIYIWQSSWKMIKDHPIIGMGMGNYLSFYKWYMMPKSKVPDASFAHNIFLQIWAECGIIALISFVGIVLFTLLKGIRLTKSPDSLLKVVGLSSLAAFVGILIHSQVDCTIYSMHIGPIFWLLAGIIFYSERIVYEEEHAHPSSYPLYGPGGNGKMHP